MCLNPSGTMYSIEQMEALEEAKDMIVDEDTLHIIGDPRFSGAEMRELMLCALNGPVPHDDMTPAEHQEIIRTDRMRVQARADEILEARRLVGRAQSIVRRNLDHAKV